MNAPQMFDFPYHAKILDAAAQASLVAQLQELDYEHQAYGATARARNYEGPGQVLERGYVQLGHAYEYNGIKRAHAPPMPDFVLALLRQVEVEVELALPHSAPKFNQAVVMHYPVGTGVEWHTDGDRFGPVIAGVSLGGAGRLGFRRRGEETPSDEFQLAPGSLYLLQGEARWHYQHMLHPVTSERWSLTFRTIAA